MRIVFLGSPGVGKGIYAQFLVQQYPWPHISVGHLLREEVRAGSARGREAERYIQEGKLVPDDVVVALLRERLQNDDTQNGFFLDGFPRNLTQAEELESITAVDTVVNFEADEAVIVQRIAGRLTCEACGKVHHAGTGLSDGDPCEACGSPLSRRPDDDPSKVRSRLHEYAGKTKPLIDYYEKKGMLVRIRHNEPIADSKAEFLEKFKHALGSP